MLDCQTLDYDGYWYCCFVVLDCTWRWGAAVSCAYLFINVPDALRFSEGVDLSGVLCLTLNC